MLSRYSIGRCVGISRSSVLFSSEWDSDPSGLILASDTAAEVSRWLESWRTVCSVRSAGSCTRTVSGIHIVRCLISTCRLSRIPVEVVRCLHGQMAIEKEHVDNNVAVRNMLLSRGIVPEQLPAGEDVKKVERRLKSEEKTLIKGKKK